MGDRSPAALPADFYFDVASPLSYLAAERVEGLFAELRWVPSLSDHGAASPPVSRSPAAAARRAAQLGLPLVWPGPGSGNRRAPTRVAALAVESGRGPGFVLAAGRLAFCGGFDLTDPEVLAEAASAAGVDAVTALDAAANRNRDGLLLVAGRRRAAREVPAVRVGGHLFAGEPALDAAALAAASGRIDVGRRGAAVRSGQRPG